MKYMYHRHKLMFLRLNIPIINKVPMCYLEDEDTVFSFTFDSVSELH